MKWELMRFLELRDLSPTRKKWDVLNTLSMILKFQTSILQ
jgi:hypothetical protein